PPHLRQHDPSGPALSYDSAMPSKRHLESRIPSLHTLLNEANRRATADLRRVVGAKGVPVEFWRVLEVMADERGRSMSELAEEAGMQLSATSKLVDRMTDAALLQRSVDPEDHRRVILHISRSEERRVGIEWTRG